MEITIKYDRTEIKDLILAETVKQFGEAPEGKEWLVTEEYGTFKVFVINKVKLRLRR